MFRSRPLVLSLLFLSGATGLVYELTWSKRLANLLGNSGQAHAIVLATFMGGLALGAFLFGRRADRSERPLRLYGVLEVGVGLCALLLPTLLDGLGRVWLSAAPGFGDGIRTATRLFLATATLLVPTLFMGGTLPAVTRALTERLSTARRDLSVLYATNSLGAALGCVLAGLWLVPTLGLTQSERWTALLNVGLGLCAIVLGGERSVAFRAQTEPEARQYGAGAVRAALLGTALAGFTSMLYELTWIRLLSVVIGGTSYAFTLILATFILGIALGSLWLSRRPDQDALRTFSRLQFALVGAVCAGVPFYERLPYVFIRLNGLLQHTPQAWALYQVVTFGFCALLLLAPTFLLGASFPAAARVAMGAISGIGEQLGLTYLANTLGTVSGSLLGGLWLLPTIGLEGNLVVGLACNLTAAGVTGDAAAPGRSPLRRFGPLVALSIGVLAWVANAQGWSLTVASSGRYREWARTFDSFGEFRTEVRERSMVRFYRDDVFASVLVGEQSGGRRYLRINGKVDGSNGSDVDTQVLAAHLGVLLHPAEVKRVLLIGVGAGITAGSLLSHPIERLDVVEISPAVIEAVEWFNRDHNNAFTDPRCHVYVEDARTFLALAPERYDLIISVPSNPWVSGVAGLFSRDFFRMAREHLAEGGRIVQWIHTYESSRPLVQLVVRTLRDSFEHGTTWVGPDDLVLVASREPQRLDLQTVATRMARPTVAADLERVRIRQLSTLLARQLQTDEGQQAFAGDGPVNTDDHNLLEYDSPVAYFIASDVEVPDERRPPHLGAGLELERFRQAHATTVDEARDLYGSLSWVHPPNDGLVRSAAERWLELDPTSPDATLAVARAALAQGNTTVAETLLTPLLRDRHPTADVLAAYLTAIRSRVRREAGPWRHVSGCENLELGRALLGQQPTHSSLGEAVERLAAACGQDLSQ